MVVTATGEGLAGHCLINEPSCLLGLKLQVMGGMEMFVDKEKVDFAKRFVYKGVVNIVCYF